MTSSLTPLVIAGLLLAYPSLVVGQASPARSPEETMSILVHITHGPEHPTRAALGFAVAAAAIQQGHSVTVFLAGDAVQLVREGVIDNLAGVGTGKLSESMDTVVSGGGRFYLSGGSSAARGLSADDVGVPHFEMAGPARLVELALEHDRQFVY